MAVAPKKTTIPIVDVVDAVTPKSRWATLRDEARKEYKPRPNYVFDGTEPPTEITAPDSIERVTALAMLVDSDGSFEAANLRKLFETVCGAAFPAVWSVVKDEPFEILFPLINDINDHFMSIPSAEGAGLPGGA